MIINHWLIRRFTAIHNILAQVLSNSRKRLWITQRHQKTPTLSRDDMTSVIEMQLFVRWYGSRTWAGYWSFPQVCNGPTRFFRFNPRIAALQGILFLCIKGQYPLVLGSPVYLIVHMPMHVVHTCMSTKWVEAYPDVWRGGEAEEVKGSQCSCFSYLKISDWFL